MKKLIAQKSFKIAHKTKRILSEEISADEFEPIEFTWQDDKSSGDFVIEKVKSLVHGNKNLATDLLLSPTIPAIENLISRCRYSLTDAEIKRFRKLGKDAGSALETIFEIIESGESERKIARKVKNSLADFNIESVVTLVGVDERIANFRHPIPTENVWKKVLLIVVCAKRNGLIASLSRIACVGEIPDELRRKTDAVAYVFAKFLSVTKRGATGAEIYRIAADAYAEKGFADEINKHHQGGAAGYKTRDWIAHPKSAEIAQNNQAFAWNPSITGTKAEETYLFSESIIENLTASPNFPKIEIKIDGKVFFAPDILKL